MKREEKKKVSNLEVDYHFFIIFRIKRIFVSCNFFKYESSRRGTPSYLILRDTIMNNYKQQRLKQPKMAVSSSFTVLLFWFSLICWQPGAESFSFSIPFCQKGIRTITTKQSKHQFLTPLTRNTIDLQRMPQKKEDSFTAPFFINNYISKSITRLRTRATTNQRSVTKRKEHRGLSLWLRQFFQKNYSVFVRKVLPSVSAVALIMFSLIGKTQSAWATAAMTSGAIAPPPPTLIMSRQLELQLCTRLLYSALMGGLVGWERSAANHSAGVRTMSLVSLGAAAFGLLSVFGFLGCVQYDPSRMASNVASGVGFIGAGVITTQNIGQNPKNKEPNSIVHGLTTAAAIWISAAVGLASGLGLYYISGMATIITVSILKFGRYKHSEWGKQMCQFIGIDPSKSFDEYDTSISAPTTSRIYSRVVQKDSVPEQSQQLQTHPAFLPATIPTYSSIRMRQLDKEMKCVSSSSFGSRNPPNSKDIQRWCNLEQPFSIQRTRTRKWKSKMSDPFIAMERFTSSSQSDSKKRRKMGNDIKTESSSSISDTKQLQAVEKDYLSSTSASLGFVNDTSLALLPSPDGIPNLLSSASEQVERVVMTRITTPASSTKSENNSIPKAIASTAAAPAAVLQTGHNATQSGNLAA